MQSGDCSDHYRSARRVGFATASIKEAGGEEESVSGSVASMVLGDPVSSVFSLRVGGMYA